MKINSKIKIPVRILSCLSNPNTDFPGYSDILGQAESVTVSRWATYYVTVTGVTVIGESRRYNLTYPNLTYPNPSLEWESSRVP